jgi:hypothetical protein
MTINYPNLKCKHCGGSDKIVERDVYSTHDKLYKTMLKGKEYFCNRCRSPDVEELSLCPSCYCMTKNIKGKCGKCNHDKLRHINDDMSQNKEKGDI